MLRPRIAGSFFSAAVRLAPCRLAERCRRRSDECRERGFLTLLLLRDLLAGCLVPVPLLYRAISSGDMGTGEDGDRLAGWMYLLSFLPRVVSWDVFLEVIFRAELWLTESSVFRLPRLSFCER